MSENVIHRVRLGPLAAAVDEQLAQLAADDVVKRVWDRDHTVWAPDPTEISDRLGWLDVPPEMLAAKERLDGFVAGCLADGLTHAVVMGMGGSSLFPEVMARTFGSAAGHLTLHVLDTTDPAAVARVEGYCPLDTSIFVASSKSGSTVETRSHLAHFWERVGRSEQFAVVTDPGSDLGKLAKERGFREVFENRPDIGGRYSALSFFGIVPAALAGVPWTTMVDAAIALEPALKLADPAANPGLHLGAILGAAVKAGRDKVTFVIDERIETFGLWLEQLLAESTGKHGTGVVPIVGESLGSVDVYGDDRIFVVIGEPQSRIAIDVLADTGHPVVELQLGDLTDIGQQVQLWEFATAICGAVLGINAFDQPNVQEAKDATKAVLAGDPPKIDLTPIDALLNQLKPGDYLSIQAYVDPEDPDDIDLITEARLRLRDEFKVATTFGLGPRFLHSTGQLHKGGPPTGVFLQVVGVDQTDCAIPDEPFTFSQLKHAQADGDLLTLGKHGLRAGRIAIKSLEEHE
ncbi:MAG TPA: hypothetical protein VGM93_15810 [Acidimicrobiales bacterium]